MSIKHLIHEAQNVLGAFKLNNADFYAGDVAAALETEDGNIHTGICFDVSCGIGFCAEHSAIAQMLKNRETRIMKIIAITKNGVIPPCGRCRELIFQVDKNNVDTIVYLEEDKFVLLEELLPHRWNP